MVLYVATVDTSASVSVASFSLIAVSSVSTAVSVLLTQPTNAVYAVISLSSGTCFTCVAIAVCGVSAACTCGLSVLFCGALKNVIISARIMVINLFICIFLSEHAFRGSTQE